MGVLSSCSPPATDRSPTSRLFPYPCAEASSVLTTHTVKLLTTSRRYHRLARDLDINAGKYLEGMSLSALCDESYEYVLKIANGQRSFGERAHHSQVEEMRGGEG